MKIAEQSIRVNDAHPDSFFIEKIPAGTSVDDGVSGISYEADGLNDELAETLSNVLEAAASGK